MKDVCFLLKCCRDNILSHIQRSSQVKNLTSWWPDCSHDVSCHSSKTGLREMENMLTLELKSNCSQNNQDDTVQTVTINFKITIRTDFAISLYSPLYMSKKFLPTLSVRESAFGQLFALTSSVASIQNKTKFSSSIWHFYWLLSSE